MNTNRNNNRRRGRNNSGRGQGGGGNNGGGNRIDSRARGNAPQLLEKYRKLAHDASLNDDRVQTEYYLQFADHYFRVLADSKQKDGSPVRNQNDRGQSFDDYDDEEDEFENGARATPRGRPEQGRDSSGREMNRGGDRRNDAEQNDDQPAEQAVQDQQRGSEGDDVDSAGVENPFIRDTGRRGRRPRAAADADGAPQAEPRNRTDGDAPVEPRGRADGAAPTEGRGRGRPRRAPVTETQEDTGFDAMVLPPSISRTDDADSNADADGDNAQDAAPARTRKAPARPRRRAARTDEAGPEDGAGETLEIVG